MTNSARFFRVFGPGRQTYRGYLHVLTVAAMAVNCAITASRAATVAQVEAQPSGATGLTIDNASGQYPVVSGILSQPGTVNGFTYSSWAFLANDGTGSMDIFARCPPATPPVLATPSQ